MDRRAALTAEARADLDSWGARYPLLDQDRFPAVALTIATHLPDRTRADRALAAALTVWIFTFDAVVDEGWITGAALDALAADCKATVAAIVATARGQGASGGPTPPREDRLATGDRTLPLPAEQIVGMLADIGAALATYHSFGDLAAYWQASFTRMIDGIVREQVLGASFGGRVARPPGQIATAPSYAKVLATAQYSIGVPHYLASCFILYDDPAIAGQLPELHTIVKECARTLRLANDLRTWRKEEREGVFNTVTALRLELERLTPGRTVVKYRDQALALLRERLARHAARTRALLAVSSTSTPATSAVADIARLFAFVLSFYAAHDYHTFQPATPE